MQRSMRYSDQQMQDRKRKIQIRNWLIVIAVVILAFVAVRFLRNLGSHSEVKTYKLPCTADQEVTVFGDNVLYYDGLSIHCVSTTGSIRWSFAVGTNVKFAVSGKNVVAWSGSQLYIVDQNGRPTYNEDMGSEVQFARVGDRYCAVVIGDLTAPELLVKNLDGTPQDSETDAFSGMMLMDVGFYGDHDQYMWTLCLDVYGVAINTVLNTFEVNRMNSGLVNLGENLAYKVLFEDNRLRVFTMQQMYTYDYRAVQDLNRTKLVHGWQLLGYYVPNRGAANLLLAPNAQIKPDLSGRGAGSVMNISEVRILTDMNDRRYTLPDYCVGAVINKDYVYAFARNTLYRTPVNNRKFDSFSLKLPAGVEATSLVGMTGNGSAIIMCNEQVYAISLPR